MFCPNCGTDNAQDAVFCANCGTPLAPAAPVVEEVAQDVAAVVETPVAETPVTEVPAMEAPVTETPVVDPNMGQPQFDPNMGQPQFDPNMAGAQFGQPMQPAKVKKPKDPNKKFPIKLVAISASVAVVLIALITTFILIGRSKSDYKKTAQEFVQTMCKGDYKKAYSLVDVPKSEFLTEEAFITSLKEAEISPVVGKINVIDYQPAVSKSSKAGSKGVKVTFNTSDGYQMDEFVMVPSKKAMLFFTTYKVDVSSIVAENFKIRIPKGLKATVNGTAISDKYLDSDYDSSVYDQYIIPYLFRGNNNLVVSGDIIEDYEKSFGAYDEGEVSVSSSNIRMTDKAVDDLPDIAKKDLETIITSAQKQSAYSAISNKVCKTDSSTVEKKYNDIVTKFKNTSKYVSFTDFKLSNISATVADKKYNIDSADGYLELKVTVKYTYSYNYQYNASSKVTPKTNTPTTSYIKYKYVDGEWVISDMSLSISL